MSCIFENWTSDIKAKFGLVNKITLLSSEISNSETGSRCYFVRDNILDLITRLKPTQNIQNNETKEPNISLPRAIWLYIRRVYVYIGIDHWKYGSIPSVKFKDFMKTEIFDTFENMDKVSS